MSVSLDAILLYSTDPARLMSFISAVFDVEAISRDAEQIMFQIASTTFQIKYKKTDIKQGSAFFALAVDDLAKLAELKQVVEFYYYRAGEQSYQLPCIHNDVLTFLDPDKRTWEIIFRPPMALSQTKVDEVNVRIC